MRSFAKFAALVGLDPEGLYLNPNSSILAALQGADFDGDIGEIIEFASNDHNDYNAVVQHILERTIDSHKKKIEAGTLTAEAAAAKQEKLKHTLEANDQKFSMSSGKDIAKFILHSAQNTARIGSASAVNRNAFQMDQAENFVLQALVDAYEHYDTNTTSVKKGITMDASLNERKVLNYGAPFSEFFRRVDKKGRDDNGNISIEKLRELNTNLYSFNLPTKYMSGNMLSALASRYIAKQQYGEDVVNGDYDWNKLFDELHGEADLSTALGRMQYGLRQAYLGFLNSDYLALSEEDASTLVELRQKAIDDITAHSDLYTDELAKYQNKKGNLTTAALAERMVNALGGKAIKNLNQDGLTETVMNSANFGFLLDSMNSMGFGSGTSSLTGFLMSQFGENAEIYEKAIQDRQKAAQEDREKRMKFFNAWGSDKADEIASNLDKHSFSYSDLKSFADNPEEWLYYAMNPKVKREHRSTDATVIGSASHKIIQDYFDAREKMIKKHSKGDNKFKFTDREIEELSKNNG